MPGQSACMASHRRAWKIALDGGFDVVAIFEDDALFPSDFQSIFPEAYKELPEDWVLWHLHSFGPGQNALKAGQFTTLLSSNGYGSHGYVIRRSLMKELLDESISRKEPVDWLLTRGMLDRKKIVFGTLNQNALCFQKITSSNIKETSVDNYYKEMIEKYFR